MLTRAAVLVAAVALPGAAGAADIRGNANTTATLPISGTYTPGEFEIPGDSDWYKVTLAAGTDYAVSSGGSFGLDIKLRDAAGRVLASAHDGYYEDGGLEFRAPRSGTYFVEYKDTPSPDSGAYPGSYRARVMSDCRGDRTTKCVLRPGRPQTRQTAWYADRDWFRVALTKGVTYTVTTDDPSYNNVHIVDADNTELAAAGQAFRPGATGTYFVRVSTEDDYGRTYSVELTQR